MSDPLSPFGGIFADRRRWCAYLEAEAISALCHDVARAQVDPAARDRICVQRLLSSLGHPYRDADAGMDARTDAEP